MRPWVCVYVFILSSYETGNKEVSVKINCTFPSMQYFFVIFPLSKSDIALTANYFRLKKNKIFHSFVGLFSPPTHMLGVTNTHSFKSCAALWKPSMCATCRKIQYMTYNHKVGPVVCALYTNITQNAAREPTNGNTEWGRQPCCFSSS